MQDKEADELADATLRWLMHADPAEPATAEVAVLMEAFDSLPVVSVRGPEGTGAQELCEALESLDRHRWWYVPGEVPAALVVRLSHDPAADGFVVNPRTVDPADLHARVGEALGSEAQITAAMGVLLRRGLEEVAVGFPSVRDELEEVLWPR